MKKIILWCLLATLGRCTPLPPENILAGAGTICSVGSYYCLVQAFDRAEAYNPERRMLLGRAAALKISSTLLLAPKFSQKQFGGVLFGVQELGALYAGAGLYILRSAQIKQTRYYASPEAHQDLCVGSLLLSLGAFTLYFAHTQED